MKNNLINIHYRIPFIMKQWIEKESKETGISESEIVRCAIALEKKKREKEERERRKR